MSTAFNLNHGDSADDHQGATAASSHTPTADVNESRLNMLDTSTSPTLDRIIDTIGAQQGDLASGDTTDDTLLALTGTGTAGETVEIYDGDTLLGAITVGADGRWMLHTPWLEDGQYHFRAKYQGSSDYSQSHAVTVETTWPVAPETASYGDRSVGTFGNHRAFAAIKADGSVVAWGHSAAGGQAPESVTAPGSNVVQVFATGGTFAALKADGSVVGWGGENDSYYGTRAPASVTEAGSGVVHIFATESAFAALKDDGSVVTWGNQSSGGSAPSSVRGANSGVVQVFATSSAFAALKEDGSVVAWGDYGAYAPSTVTAPNSGVVQIFAGSRAFAALKEDGSVVTWGDSSLGGYTGNISGLSEGVVQVYANFQSFAALKADGSVVVWGIGAYGGNNAPDSVTAPGSGVVHIVNSSSGFAALKADGSVVSWGYSYHNMNSQGVAGLDGGVISVVANSAAFAAVKVDGSVVAWGHLDRGGTAPLAVTEPGSGVIQVFNTGQAFAALKADGSVFVWGDPAQGGANAPDSVTAPGSGVVQIFTTSQAFAALKSDGTVVVWGNPERGGSAEGLDLSGIIAVSNPFDSAISLDPNPALAYSIEDATGQATGPLTDGDTTDETTPAFSGTVSSEATVSLYVNGTLLDSVRANENGQWSYTPETALADGEYAFHVLVFAANGTYLGFSPTVTITVDGPPGVPTLALAEDTGADTTDGLTANPTIQVGNLKTDATWEYRINGGDWLAGSGSSFDLGEGEYAVGQIEVRQTAGGQTTPVGTNTTPILVDLTEPALLSGVSLPGGGATNDNLVSVDLSSLESEAIWEYSLDGGQTWNLGLGSSFLLNDGEYAAGDIQVRQVDAAGNPGEPVSTTADVTIDTVLPNTPVITSDLLTNEAEPIIAGTAEPDSTVVASVGGAVYTVTADAQGRWSVNLALLAPDSGTGPLNLQANGENAISVTATDAAGNTSTAGSQTLVIDTTPPAAPDVTLPPAGATNISTLIVAGLEADATWEYSLDGGANWRPGENGQAPLDDGSYAIGQIQVRQVDAAGNPGTVVSNTGVITVDTQEPPPPSITSATLSNSLTPEISGTAEANSTITLTLGDAIYTVQANADGDWALDLANQPPDTGTGPLNLQANGSHAISVTATDAAGNTSTAGSQTLVTDTTPPVEPDVTLPPAGATNVDTLLVAGLEADATWEYSLDGGANWRPGENGQALLDDGSYAIGQIQVRQVDAAGNPGTVVSNTGVITVDTQEPLPPAITSATLSNSLTPAISGTAEANTTITLTLDDAIYTVLANADGDWALDLANQPPDTGTGPLNLQANGSNVISVTATDAAGNTSTAGSQTLVIDTTPPAEPDVTLPPAGATNIDTLLVAGLETEATWEYSLDGGANWRPGENGQALLDDGSYAIGQIQVRQVDAAGNSSPVVSNTGIITVDTQEPLPPAITSATLSNSLTPAISGTAEANSTIILTLGDAVYTAQADAEGDWTLDLATQPPDTGTGPLNLQANGDNAISVTATDAAGNTSTAGSQTLVIDTTPPPVPTGVTLPTGGPTNESTVTVDLAVLEEGATWQYSLDGGHTWENGEGDSFALEDGDYAAGDIQVRQVDAAGNPSQPAGTIADVTLDTVLPDVPEITSNPLTNTAKPVIAGTAEPGSTVVVNVDSATFTLTVGDAGDWSLDLALAAPDAGSDPLNLAADGEHVVSVTATDAAGNTSTAGSQTLVIDTTPPLAPDGVTLPTGGPTNTATVTLDLHTLENGATWQYSVDGGQTWQDGQGSSFPLEDGDYAAGAIQVRQVDAAGNLGEPVSTTAGVTVDTAPPIPPTIDTPALTNEMLPVISGTAEADSTLIVTIGGATYTVQATANGDWSLDLATQPPDNGTGPLDLDANGVNPISVKARDAAGNSSEVAGQTLTIDTTPPAIPGGVMIPGGGPTRIDSVAVDLSALEDGARWQYSLDGGQTWHEGEGDSFHLDDGDYAAGQIQVRQVDAAGNSGQPASTTNVVIIDTVAPTAPTIDSPNLTNQITPILSGTAEAGSTLTVSLDGAVYTVQADENGDWTLDLANQPPDHGTGPLSLEANGDNTLSVTATDAAGNTSTAGSQTLVIDTTPPATPRATLPGGGASSTNVVTISGLEADALWQYSLDGGNIWRDGSGQQFLIPDGDYRPGQIQVRQLDPAGNPSEPVRTSANVSIDTAAPLPPLLAVTEREGHIWIDVSRLEASASWHYSLDGGATWLTGSGTAFALPPGQYPAGSLQVRQTDSAGNVSPVGRHEQAVDSRDTPPDTPVDPADTDGDGIPDALEAQYGLIVGVKDNDVFARDDLFVLQLYRDGLAREADAGGLAHWLDGLEQTDRGSVVEAFLKTVEVWSHPVVQFYQVVLDRLPDSPGLRAWMHEAESGASLAAIADAFLVSPEFSSRFGTPDDQTFIDLLYGQVLEREADSGGSTYWLEVLASGTSRGEVLLGFVASPEHLAQSGQPAAVVVAYSSLLGRMPTADEYDTSLLYLAGSGSVYGLVNELMATQEYAARFLPEAGSVSGLPVSAGVDVDSWLG